MNVSLVFGWLLLGISFTLNAYMSWYARRSLGRSIKALDAGIAAFDAALVARSEALAARSDAAEDRLATLELLKQTRRILGQPEVFS